MKIASTIAVATATLVTQACGNANTDRKLVDVIFESASANAGVFIWTEPGGPDATRIFFAAGEIEANQTYEDILLQLKPFGSADFSASTVRYGWDPARVFNVCAEKTELLPAPDPVALQLVANATVFSNGACDDTDFGSFPLDRIQQETDV